MCVSTVWTPTCVIVIPISLGAAPSSLSFILPPPSSVSASSLLSAATGDADHYAALLLTAEAHSCSSPLSSFFLSRFAR